MVRTKATLAELRQTSNETIEAAGNIRAIASAADAKLTAIQAWKGSAADAARPAWQNLYDKLVRLSKALDQIGDALGKAERLYGQTDEEAAREISKINEQLAGIRDVMVG